jgi:hypothetical protein
MLTGLFLFRSNPNYKIIIIAIVILKINDLHLLTMTTENNQLSIRGIITDIGSADQGENWSKQEFTITTVDKYPKEVRISVWNANIEWLSRCKLGDEVVVLFNVQSRKHNDKYYTELSAWRIDVDILAMKKRADMFNKVIDPKI